MVSVPAVGEKFCSLATSFLASHGIPDGVEFIITNVSADKISLYMCFSHGRVCPGKITVAKVFFGSNFEEDELAVNQAAAYRCATHWYPEVSESGVHIFPSKRFSYKNNG